MAGISTQTVVAQGQLSSPGRAPNPLEREKLFERLLRNKDRECYERDGKICHVSLVGDRDRNPRDSWNIAAPKDAYYQLYYRNRWGNLLYFDASGRALAYDRQELESVNGRMRATGRMLRVTNVDQIERYYNAQVKPILDPRFLAQPGKGEVDNLKKLIPAGTTRSIDIDDAVMSLWFKGKITHSQTGMLIFNLAEGYEGSSAATTLRIVLDANGKIRSAVSDNSNPLGPNAQKMSNGKAGATVDIISHRLCGLPGF